VKITLGSTSGWSPVIRPPGAVMIHISFDGRTLVGTDNQNSIWAKTSGGNWRRITGSSKLATVLGSRIYGLNRLGEIQLGSTGESNNGNWSRIPGKLKQIHFDGFTLGGCNFNDFVYFSPTASAIRWRRAPGQLQWLTFFGDTAYGANSKGEVYIGNTRGNPQWRQLKTASLVQVSYDGIRLAGVNEYGHDWMVETNLKDPQPSDWTYLGSAMKQVEIFNEHLYGVRLDGAISYFNLHASMQTFNFTPPFFKEKN